MAYNIYSVKLPLQSEMSKVQLNLLENYENIYKELNKTPKNRQLVSAALKVLIQLYELFSAELQQKYQYWYKFQITVIDPLVTPYNKISDLILQCDTENDLGNRTIISQDKLSILVPVDNNFASTKFLELMNQEFPKMKLQKVKIG